MQDFLRLLISLLNKRLKIWQVLFFIVALMSINSCKIYRNININELNYTQAYNGDSVIINSCDSIFYKSKNKGFANKAARIGYKFSSIEVINRSSCPISLGQDILFFLDTIKLRPKENLSVASRIRRLPYLSFLILPDLVVTLLYSNSISPSGRSVVITLGTIGFIDRGISITSNNKLYSFFDEHDVRNKIVEPEDTGYAVISYKNKTGGALLFSVSNEFSLKDISNYEILTDTSDKGYFLKIFPVDTIRGYYHSRVRKQLESLPRIKDTKFQNKYSRTGKLLKRGIVIKASNFRNEEYFKVGAWYHYRKNGTLKRLLQYDLNGLLHGDQYFYDIRGFVQKTVKYNHGRRIK